MAPQGGNTGEVRGNMGGNIKAKRGKEVMHIKRNVDTKIVTILVGLVILSGCILSNIGTNNGIISSNNASATSDGSSSTTNVSVTVSDACTMSVSGNQGTVGEDGNYTYSATIQGGTNGEIIANSIKTFCNDFSGFSIYAIGYSNDTLSNTDLVYNNTTTNNYNIKTDATGIYNSYWQMKLANNTTTNVTTTIPTTYQDYNVIPNDYTLVAQYNSNTGNTDTTSSIITPSYKVYIASAQPAGTYTGKVKYTLVHPMNAAKPEMPKIFGGITTMQEMTPQICSAAAENDTAQLEDTRDHKLYWVTKLADNNCWMTENLDLGSTSGTITLDSDDTNLATGATYTLPTATLLSVAFTDESKSLLERLNVGNKAYGIIIPDTPAGVVEHGEVYIIGSNTYSSLDSCKNVVGGDNAEEVCEHSTIGNHYDWSVATAGSDVGYANAPYSICPKGWRLPMEYYGTNGEFETLNSLYNNGSTSSDAGLRSTPLFFVWAGSVRRGSLGGVGSGGYYWSSTVSNGVEAYELYFGSSVVYPTLSSRRVNGYSVRCVAG